MWPSSARTTPRQCARDLQSSVRLETGWPCARPAPYRTAPHRNAAVLLLADRRSRGSLRRTVARRPAEEALREYDAPGQAEYPPGQSDSLRPDESCSPDRPAAPSARPPKTNARDPSGIRKPPIGGKATWAWTRRR